MEGTSSMTIAATSQVATPSPNPGIVPGYMGGSRPPAAPAPSIGTPRSVNPGIVPPWLQHAPGEVAPGTGQAAEAPAPTPVTTARRGGEGALATARESIKQLATMTPGTHEAKFADGDVIGFLPDGTIVRIPARPQPDRGRIEQVLQREQDKSQALVEDVRGFFTKLGVTDAEGNDDDVVVEFLPDFDNAAYIPEADHIHIGIDPRTGHSFADGRDVIAHEYSHRIIDRLSHGLQLGGEDSAIHESLADTFAAAYDGDWTMGEDLGEPIRIMDHPERMGHPGHVADLDRVLAPGSPFMHEEETRSGRIVEVPDMHVVAGIPNKAASIIGDELGKPTMAKIYINALRDYVRPGRQIEGLAAATMLATKDLFGAESHEFDVVEQAWDRVGVLDLLKEQAGQRGQ
jgi:hypothetical protein